MRGPRDEVEYLCTLCGRTGFRQFDETRPPLPAGHRCRNRDKCADRIRMKIEAHNRELALVAATKHPAAQAKTPDESPTKVLLKSMLPHLRKFDLDDGDLQERAIAKQIAPEEITARCMDCTRIWTAPDPTASVTKHEEGMNHLVELVTR